ncbi:MAG: protein archease [Nanohaloarchaea archaeon]|nr:protein archease [Candidatus Nanohaloarchaea archaeon]
MKKYDFLPHTADAKFVAYGKTCDEAFANCAVAMFSVMVVPETVKPKIKKLLKIEAEDLESLVYDWLEHLLVLLDSENFILSSVGRIVISKIDEGYLLDAEFTGDTISDDYDILGFVKAVTYNDMEIKEKDGVWHITVVVDR